mmetsp:Transcript_78510/g.202176  ORF Transcript_78510/g.202176 Transcript_78510/m.202176 type:complete len:231 (+) Transcript_78510:377-1069(+)
MARGEATRVFLSLPECTAGGTRSSPRLQHHLVRLSRQVQMTGVRLHCPRKLRKRHRQALPMARTLARPRQRPMTATPTRMMNVVRANTAFLHRLRQVGRKPRRNLPMMVRKLTKRRRVPRRTPRETSMARTQQRQARRTRFRHLNRSMRRKRRRAHQHQRRTPIAEKSLRRLRISRVPRKPVMAKMMVTRTLAKEGRRRLPRRLSMVARMEHARLTPRLHQVRNRSQWET